MSDQEDTTGATPDQAPQSAEPTAAPPQPVDPPHDSPSAEQPQQVLQAPLAPRSHVGVSLAIAVIVALVIGAIAGLAGGFAGARLAAGPSSVNRVPVVSPSTNEPIVAAAAAAVPSVVNVEVREATVTAGTKGLPSTHPNVPSKGTGSGVAFRSAPDGGTYILTNQHVVGSASRITVRSTSGKSWPATLVGGDADNDIAVIKIAEKLPVIDIGDSKKLVVGQTVATIGSPFGLEHSVAAGVVSALGRSLPDFTEDTPGAYPLVDVIQTDASINPGNSGGALVDRLGKLVGINTAMYTDTGASGGVGFAVPVNKAILVADQLITSGKVSHPFLGIIGQTLTPELAASKGISVEEGALVEEVAKDSGAEKAGVKAGDVVLVVGDAPIRSMDDLILQVRRISIGETVELKLLRGGSPVTVKITVGDRPADYAAPATKTPTPKK